MTDNPETYDALVNAIEAHINAESEGDDRRMVTDWIVMAAHVGQEPGRTGYLLEFSNSPTHSIDGLIVEAGRMMNNNEED